MKKLKRNLDELFERGILFIKNIKRDEKTFIIYHKDADGICSAGVILKAFEKLNLEPTEIAASSNEEIEEVIKKIKDFDKTIILDIDISYLRKELEALDKNILLIDHHPPRADLNNEKIAYINPVLRAKGVYQPVAYLAFKLFSRIANLNDVEWVSVLGTIGDMGFEDCKDLLERWVKIKNKYDLTKTVFWGDVGRLNGYATTHGFDNALKLIRTFHSLSDLRENVKIKDAYKGFIKELKKLKRAFWENAKIVKEAGLIISEIGIKQRALSSFLSTNLAVETPNKVIVLMRNTNGMCAINARYNGSGLELGKIMEKSAKGLNGGGGHANAAGATIKAENKGIFKERLIKELKRFSGKKR